MGEDPLQSDDQSTSDVVRTAFQRAGLHWLRAGYEVLAGVSAFLDELASHRGEEPAGDGRATRIELED
ncbi:MAG TPA: hypothetical protein VGC47_04855 [Acidimicrobiia bacterium]|jgi:hypothetical protein